MSKANTTESLSNVELTKIISETTSTNVLLTDSFEEVFSTEPFLEIIPPELSEVHWFDLVDLETLSTHVDEIETLSFKCKFETPWISFDEPLNDGTGEHELVNRIDPCSKFKPYFLNEPYVHMTVVDKEPYSMKVREKNSHLPVFVRNIIFHKQNNKYKLGFDTKYGLRFDQSNFLR